MAYKFFERYKQCGLDGPSDRSRHPYRHANRLPFQVERSIAVLKKEYPGWEAPKIRAKLIREYPRLKPPTISIVHAVARSGPTPMPQTLSKNSACRVSSGHSSQVNDILDKDLQNRG